MRPVRIVRGDGAALALAGASEQGDLDVARSCRRPPVRATRVVDLEAVTATWPDDPWRALLAEVRGLEDVLQGVVYQGAEGRDGGELVGAVQRQLQETLARAAGLPALRPVLALAPSQEDAP